MVSSFSAYFALDAYSSHSKLMGRQKNGEHFLQALVDRAMLNPKSPETVWAGFEQQSPQSLRQLLLQAGFRGALRWQSMLKPDGFQKIGTLYYPAPPTVDLANLRSTFGPGSCSLMGLTHTLSSAGALDQLCALALPPFQDWDALICTSKVAQTLAKELIDSTTERFASSTGAHRFPKLQLPLIPLGVQASRFQTSEALRQTARAQWNFSPSDFVVLFVGRLTFHAKANPAPMYQALQTLASSLHARRVVCLESGQFPNQGIESAFQAARSVLAPDVSFITVDGSSDYWFNAAWRAADVFLSGSDNIQETFGLTPIEAMAAELPVVVSDWNGYKDTVIHQQTGFRIPTYLPDSRLQAGSDLAIRHAVQVDTYDFYIGRVSMATVIDPHALQQALFQLASQPALGRAMGKEARAHVLSRFDWSVILPQYEALAEDLNARRLAAIRHAPHLLSPQSWVQRPDPFKLFSHFASAHLTPGTQVEWKHDTASQWQALEPLSMIRYGFHPELGDDNLMRRLIKQRHRILLASDWINQFNLPDQPAAVRMLMMAAKLGLCRFRSSD
jgi:glycosyltransferase involved in cell wall biosynthesis